MDRNVIHPSFVYVFNPSLSKMYCPSKVLDSIFRPKTGTSTHNRPFRLRNWLISHDPNTNPRRSWTAVDAGVSVLP